MSLQVSITIQGDDFLRDNLDKFPKQAGEAAKLAINATLDRGYTRIKRRIGEKANLKPAYIGSRLDVKKADKNSLYGSIIGRYRATSLARFDPVQMYSGGKGSEGRKKAGLSIKVKTTRRKIPRAFLMGLKSDNKGLAIRVPAGQKPKRLFEAKPLYSQTGKNAGKDSDVYLLYGPSVHQIMTSDKTGRSLLDEVTPELTEYLNLEFKRQFARLRDG